MKKKTNIGSIVALGALLFVGGISLTSVTVTETQLNAEVREDSITPVVEKYIQMPGFFDSAKTFVLNINSPGGSVYQEEYLINMLTQSKSRIVTKVPSFAASAATSIFLAGDERLIGKDAVLMFHEVRIMVAGEVITYTDLKTLLEDGYFSNMKSQHFVNMELAQQVKDLLGRNLKAIVENIDKTHERHIKYLMERTGLDRETIEAEIVIPNVDKELNAEDALRLNIATGVL